MQKTNEKTNNMHFTSVACCPKSL